MTKDKNPWMQFFPGDWMKDLELSRVSCAARGVWIDMICLMHESDEPGVLISCGQPLTVEEAVGALRGDQGVISSGIQELLRCGVLRRRNDGALFCSRMVREQSIRQARASAGSLGGLAKAKQNASKTSSKTPSKPLSVTSDSVSNSSSEKKEEEKKKRAEELYALYPVKKGKGAALRAICKALDKTDFSTLRVAVERFRDSPEVQENLADAERKRFVKHPATWFNQRCWEDEEPSAPDNPWFSGDPPA